MIKILKKIRNWILFLCSIYLVSWLLKGMLILIYVVPSNSMQPTIYNGDYVAVLKFPYRLGTPEFYPFLNIPFPFISFQGVKSFKKYDVLVFHSPINTDKPPALRLAYVKRAIGFPGDSIYIKQEMIIDESEIENFQDVELISIPKKGETVSLSRDNIDKWKTTIQRDGVDIDIMPDSTIIINNIKTDSYTFTQNFYFMSSDNPDRSSDSRHWGLVPENHIIGKAWCIIWPLRRASCIA